MEIKKTFQFYKLLKIVALILLFISISSLIHNLLVIRKNNKELRKNITQNSETIHKPQNNNIRNSNTNEVKKDSLNHSAADNSTAQNLEESALFENLIDSHYRGSVIEVNTPRLKQQFTIGQPIVFELSGDLSKPVIIAIYSNKGTKLTEKKSISTNTFTISDELPPGLYYWKLMQEEKLIQAGKFFLK